MINYIIRRLLLIVPTLFMVTIIVFSIIRFVPGDIIDLMLLSRNIEANEETRADLKHQLGLDVPIYTQYGRWLGILPYPDKGFAGILEGDLGDSLWTDSPVIDEILNRLPVTFELGLLSILMSLTISLPIGIYSAIRQDTVSDYVARTFSIVLIALPGFWIATMVIVLPSVYWGWSPPMIYVPLWDNPAENLGMCLIPAFILAMNLSGSVTRMTRTMMLEVLRQDYIRTAWAKGQKERTVIYRHALRNAMIPVITILGLQLPGLVSGAVVIEQIFNLPGMGRFLLTVTAQRDYTSLSGVNLFIASAVLLINLGVDLAYAYIDPRVHYK